MGEKYCFFRYEYKGDIEELIQELKNNIEVINHEIENKGWFIFKKQVGNLFIKHNFDDTKNEFMKYGVIPLDFIEGDPETKVKMEVFVCSPNLGYDEKWGRELEKIFKGVRLNNLIYSGPPERKGSVELLARGSFEEIAELYKKIRDSDKISDHSLITIS